MPNYIKTLAIILIIVPSLQGQQLGQLFEEDEYTFHQGVDSIVSTKYIMNGYADDAPDFNFTYDGTDMGLHSSETTVLKYSDKLTSVSTKTDKVLSNQKIQTLNFNEAGKVVYMQNISTTTEMFNEEKVYTYDDMGRLIMQVRTGYNTLEYEGGNTDIYTDTVMMRTYGQNNLVESAQFTMPMGIAMKINTKTVGDTIQYHGEMKMSGPMAEHMPGKKQEKKHLMDVVLNNDTGNYEAIEKMRGGMISKQIIDESGQTIEKIISSKEEVIGHQIYNYEGGKLSSVEVVKGAAPEVEMNDMGQKVSEQTMMGLMKYEYDEKGNLIQEISINPYSMEFQEVTVHKVFYNKE